MNKHLQSFLPFIICIAGIVGAGLVITLLKNCLSSYDSAMERIRDRGYLIVLTENNANTYYIYRDTPMGFEYDLARAFADYLDVDIQVEVPGWSRLLDRVNTSRGDIIAASMTMTPSRAMRVDFADPYLEVQQRVIVHKDNYNVNSTADLNGRIIHVREGTSYQQSLEKLKKEGLDLTIKAHRDIPTEEFIQMVAEKTIEITIADSNIANLSRRFHPDIKIGFAIEEKQSLAWAVAKGETDLLEEINNFLATIIEDGTFDKIYSRYYSAVDLFDYVDIKKFHWRLESRLPRYEAVIRAEAEKNGFDWRLIAAVIYQESHFDPYATSYTGVRGLMQLTRRTAQEMGVSNRLDPVESIRGGVRYLALMESRFDDIDDPHTRLLFALASYNIGYGHMRDAQKIAVDLGLPPDKWLSLEKTLPLLRNNRYYRNTRYGYARGTEAVQYVKRIMTYYDILKQKARSGVPFYFPDPEAENPIYSGQSPDTKD